MFFSKLFLPLFTCASIATLAFAAPALLPASLPGSAAIEEPVLQQLEPRQQLDTVQGIIASLEQELAPLLTNLTSLAGTIQTGLAKAQLDGLLGQIESIIGNVTADLGAAVPVITTAPVATAAPSLPITPEDITALINTVVGFLTSLTGALGSLPISSPLPSTGGTNGLDAALSAFLAALEKILPGITGQIGQTLPAGTLGLLGLLKLSSVVSSLGLDKLLGGLLGNLLGAIGL